MLLYHRVLDRLRQRYGLNRAAIGPLSISASSFAKDELTLMTPELPFISPFPSPKPIFAATLYGPSLRSVGFCRSASAVRLVPRTLAKILAT